MNEFKQKLIIALIAAFLGGAIGFGSKFILAQMAEESEQIEFARKAQLEFLLDMYKDRKDAYLEFEAARFRAYNNPTDSNVDAVVEAFSSIPFIGPRIPTNVSVLGFRNEIGDRLSSLNGPEEIKNFLRHDMGKYNCVFDVNLRTIENMIAVTANNEEITEFFPLSEREKLWTLDNACIGKSDVSD